MVFDSLLGLGHQVWAGIEQEDADAGRHLSAVPYSRHDMQAVMHLHWPAIANIRHGTSAVTGHGP